MRLVPSLAALLVAALAGLVSISACTESVENDPPLTYRDSGTDAVSDVADSVPDGVAVDEGPADAVASGGVVFNEIDGDQDFIELTNVGTTPADLGKWGLGGETADGGLGSVFEFPPGTTLSPKAFLLVRAKISDAGSGPTSDCGDAGVSTCFQVSWGISGSRGETLRLMRPDGTNAATGVLPPGVASGRSWCRIPDGTGDLKACTPTPGATNQE
jgi:hypothetical protein